ncbi:hypothetical protein [Streptomyces sp. NPDC004528]|uniref:hypothetical protein n=1 Tax=Streptomyces sp. NPDC004528 TaxID=3154550 RepID=UPI00339FEB5B
MSEMVRRPPGWACDASMSSESGVATGASVRCDEWGKAVGQVVVVRFEPETAGSSYYEVANVLAAAMRSLTAGSWAPVVYGDLDGIDRGLKKYAFWGQHGFPDRIPLELQRLVVELGEDIERIQYERLPRNSTSALALADRTARLAMRGRRLREDIVETTVREVVEEYRGRARWGTYAA